MHARQVKDAIPLSLGPLQSAVANLRSQPWAASIPSADSFITGCCASPTSHGLGCSLDIKFANFALPVQPHVHPKCKCQPRTWRYHPGLCCSAVGALSQTGLMLDEKALRSVAPAIDQLNSVFNEVHIHWTRHWKMPTAANISTYAYCTTNTYLPMRECTEISCLA